MAMVMAMVVAMVMAMVVVVVVVVAAVVAVVVAMVVVVVAGHTSSSSPSGTVSSTGADLLFFALGAAVGGGAVTPGIVGIAVSGTHAVRQERYTITKLVILLVNTLTRRPYPNLKSDTKRTVFSFVLLL